MLEHITRRREETSKNRLNLHCISRRLKWPSRCSEFPLPWTTSTGCLTSGILLSWRQNVLQSLTSWPGFACHTSIMSSPSQPPRISPASSAPVRADQQPDGDGDIDNGDNADNEDEPAGGDLPMSMTASVILTNLPRDASQALQEVDEIDNRKGMHVVCFLANGDGGWNGEGERVMRVSFLDFHGSMCTRGVVHFSSSIGHWRCSGTRLTLSFWLQCLSAFNLSAPLQS